MQIEEKMKNDSIAHDSKEAIQDHVSNHQPLNKELLRPFIKQIIFSHDMTTFTPRMLFIELAKSMNQSVEDITQNLEIKCLIKTVAKEVIDEGNMTLAISSINATTHGETSINDSRLQQCRKKRSLTEGKNTEVSDRKKIRVEKKVRNDEETDQEKGNVETSLQRKDIKSSVDHHLQTAMKKTVNKEKRGTHVKPKSETGFSSGETEIRQNIRERIGQKNVCQNKEIQSGPAGQDVKIKKLRKLVTTLGFGPTLYKGLPQDFQQYYEELKKRLIDKCVMIGVIPNNEYRLPTSSEASTHKTKRDLEKELEGLELGNILESSERPKRRRLGVIRPITVPLHSEGEECESSEEDSGHDSNGGPERNTNRNNGTSSRKSDNSDSSESENNK